MKTLDRLIGCMPEETEAYILEKAVSIREVRLRVGCPAQIISDEDRLIGPPVSREMLKAILFKLTDFSVYAKENELKEGFFALQDGSRVGVCGRAIFDNGKVTGLTHIGAICIRIAREKRGCASELLPHIQNHGVIRSTLIFSPPGLGKTTCLRDIARMLSDSGYRIGISDERHEIAACIQGAPSLDVGKRTDVMDGCPKEIAVHQMIRTMSPQVLVTDEIGDINDARALQEASRCGISVIASAHAGSFEDLSRRAVLSTVLQTGVFELGIRLGDRPGNIVEMRKYAGCLKGEIVWECV